MLVVVIETGDAGSSLVPGFTFGSMNSTNVLLGTLFGVTITEHQFLRILR